MTTYTWLNPTSGDWTSTLGWVPIGTPGAADSAVFNVAGSYTVSVSSADVISITNVTMSTSGAALDVDGALTISGVLTDQIGLVAVLSGGTTTITNTTGTSISEGVSSGGNGTIEVSGANSLLTTAGGMAIGKSATGTLEALNGGTISVTGVVGLAVGVTAGGVGSIVVSGTDAGSGAGALLNIGTTAKGLFIGGAGSGALTVSNGGTVRMNGTAGLSLGTLAPGAGTITVTGTGSVIDMGTASGITVGAVGSGVLNILNGGLVNAGTQSVIVGDNGSGAATITGGTLNAGVLTIAGASVVGTVTVNAGGVVGLAGGSIAAGLTIGTVGVLDLAGGVMKVAGLSTNSGRITGSGFLNGGVSNTGTMIASGGVLDIAGTIAGTGVDQIAGSATLEADGGVASGQSISFQTSPSVAALDLTFLNAPTQSFALSNWQNGDELIIGTGDTVTGAQWLGNGTLAVTTSAGVDDFTSVSLAAGTTPIFTTGTNFVELVSCFAAGTLIDTVDGPIAVEALREGDLLPTLIEGAPMPVVWIGRRAITCARHPEPATVWPVRVAAGAFRDGLPRRDLLLSPDHAVYANGVLVPVKYLLNGGSIRQEQRDRITYFHVELPAHEVIRAEGLPVESYLDIGDRAMFHTRDDATRTRRSLPVLWETLGAAPLVVAGPELTAARALAA